MGESMTGAIISIDYGPDIEPTDVKVIRQNKDVLTAVDTEQCEWKLRASQLATDENGNYWISSSYVWYEDKPK
jgi:hypothetical protein